MRTVSVLLLNLRLTVVKLHFFTLRKLVNMYFIDDEQLYIRYELSDLEQTIRDRIFDAYNQTEH